MTEEKRQEKFIRRITDQIHDRERADEIKDEMRDHLETAVADYTQMGLSQEEAGEKARKQMGDPAALGYALAHNVPKRWTKWHVLIVVLLLLQGVIAIRFVLNSWANGVFDWLDLLIVGAMVIIASAMTWVNLKRKPQLGGQPIMVIRANETLSSLDQVTTGMVLLGIGLVVMGTVMSMFGEEGTVVPVMNSLFMATNWIVIWTGQRAGSAVYAEGIQFNGGKLLSWSEYNSYRVLVSHTKKGKVYQIKLYGGKMEPILGVESSQLRTVETLVSQYLVHA
jgi:nitrogen fixation protein FixH